MQNKVALGEIHSSVALISNIPANNETLFKDECLIDDSLLICELILSQKYSM
jgi:hypothetical protein